MCSICKGISCVNLRRWSCPLAGHLGLLNVSFIILIKRDVFSVLEYQGFVDMTCKLRAMIMHIAIRYLLDAMFCSIL